MLLTKDQTEKLKYIVNDKSGKASFLYEDNSKATIEDLKYAIEIHEVYSYGFGKPFIGNIEELKKRVKEIEG